MNGRKARALRKADIPEKPAPRRRIRRRAASRPCRLCGMRVSPGRNCFVAAEGGEVVTRPKFLWEGVVYDEQFVKRVGATREYSHKSCIRKDMGGTL
jgi:hypothetical protein